METETEKVERMGEGIRIKWRERTNERGKKKTEKQQKLLEVCFHTCKKQTPTAHQTTTKEGIIIIIYIFLFTSFNHLFIPL